MRKIYDQIADILSEDTLQTWQRIHVVNLSNDEIIDYLSNNIISDKKEIDKRLNEDYIYIIDENGVQIVTNKKLVAEAQEIINKKISQEISGQIAYKGKVVGKVIIVKDKTDLSKVKEGNILVTRVTMPDYTPAMRVAAAFVTEEGGITSHAAIIARELKKPCIVGTGNCTKILKDGDMVEVDADNGIVNIIKHE